MIITIGAVTIPTPLITIATEGVTGPTHLMIVIIGDVTIPTPQLTDATEGAVGHIPHMTHLTDIQEGKGIALFREVLAPQGRGLVVEGALEEAILVVSALGEGEAGGVTQEVFLRGEESIR